jgi:hypothetical protein
MNLDSAVFKRYCDNPEQLVQVILFVPGSQAVNIRIGRIKSYDNDVLVLAPHNNKLAENAYGGDINAKYDIHEAGNIKEILILSEEESILKQIIKDNATQES